MHTHHIRLIALVLATAAFLTAQPASRADTLLYSQPPRGYGFAFSYGAGDPNPNQGYDNFTLSSDANIGVVSWEGTYVNYAKGNFTPSSTQNTTSFAISFYADSGGKPGSLLGISTIAVADLTIVYAGVMDTFITYRYTATLPTPISATGGRQYWIEIFSNSTSVEPTWCWQAGLGGDGHCYIAGDGNNPPGSFGIDLTFSLATAPPAPAITVAATVPEARVGKPGVFTLTSSKPATTKTVIHYLLKGTAVDGQDYKFLNGTATIKANQKSVKIHVRAKDSLDGAKSKQVKLVLAPASGYIVGTPKAAQIEILTP